MKIHVNFATLDIPAPFAHKYNLEIVASESNLDVKFELTYLDRDSVDLDEVLSEGFTENDDYSWNGKLSKEWVNPTTSFISNLPKNADELPSDYSQSVVTIKNGADEKTYYDHEEIEYFLQELIQAIYETAKREAPLTVFFKKIEGKTTNQFNLQVNFSDRQITLKSNDQQSDLGWEKGKDLLQLIYLADYQMPPHKNKKEGTYVSFDNNAWYNLKEVEKAEEIAGFSKKISESLNSIF